MRRAAAAEGGVAARPCLPFGTRRLPDRASSRRRVAELMSAERVEHLAMHPEPAFSAEALAVASPLDIAILKRGVRLRSLGRPPADGDLSARHATELTRLGAQYRQAARLPHKMMIFDRRVALLAVDPLDLGRGTWEIVDPATVDSLVSLFVQHWSGAMDPHRNGVPALVLTPREKALIGLLAEGHTDATAAQHLGMSTRSVTYALRALMDRLGVENRFQLGLALGALGAVAPPEQTPSEEHEA
jgi:DNA-binding CsgD family transcriptional regulator